MLLQYKCTADIQFKYVTSSPTNYRKKAKSWADNTKAECKLLCITCIKYYSIWHINYSNIPHISTRLLYNLLITYMYGLLGTQWLTHLNTHILSKYLCISVCNWCLHSDRCCGTVLYITLNWHKTVIKTQCGVSVVNYFCFWYFHFLHCTTPTMLIKSYIIMALTHPLPELIVYILLI